MALAIILPGSGYGPQAPLLHWPRRMLDAAGWNVRTVAWAPGEREDADPVAVVERHLQAHLRGGRPDLVVAKSYGCFALPWARRHDVRGVWLTPVMTDDRVAAAVRAARPDDLVVGGDADPMWLPDAAAGSAATVLTVAGADHALEVTGDWERSQRLQADVFREIARIVAS
jgi:hypothetical protein